MNRLLAAFLLAFSLTPFPFASAQGTLDPSPAPAGQVKIDPWTAVHDQCLAALNSGDAQQIERTINELRASFVHAWWYRERPINLLIEAKRYEDAEQMAVFLVL